MPQLSFKVGFGFPTHDVAHFSKELTEEGVWAAADLLGQMFTENGEIVTFMALAKRALGITADSMLSDSTIELLALNTAAIRGSRKAIKDRVGETWGIKLVACMADGHSALRNGGGEPEAFTLESSLNGSDHLKASAGMALGGVRSAVRRLGATGSLDASGQEVVLTALDETERQLVATLGEDA